MTFEAYTAAGVRHDLGTPVSARINRSEDAPADDFTGIFPFKKSWPQFLRLRVTKESGTVFSGLVDEQTVLLEHGASVQRLVARSRAALLLDNEALPQTYYAPSLWTIFLRHAAPYGFTQYLGEPANQSGELAVAKGMSEWQVIRTFCARFLGVTPRVTREGVLDASGGTSAGALRFGGAGIPYLSLSRKYRYHALLSEVFVQSRQGGFYTARAADQEAQRLGIVRRRYLGAGAATTAERMLAAARRAAEETTLVCLEGADFEPGMRAAVEDAELGTFSGMTVAKIVYTLDADGELCTVTLRPAGH